MPYARDKDAIAICDRSGQKMLRADMIEDGYLRGMMVHPDWFDGPQQQEEPFDPEEGIAIWMPRPDNVQPMPYAPVLSGAIVGSDALLNWTQQDTPWGTLKNWYVWRQLPGMGYIRIATVNPIIPVDIFVQLPDLIGREEGTVPVVSGLTYTDTSWVSGSNYYVTGIWWGQNSGLTLSPPSNIVNVTQPPLVLTAGFVIFDPYYGFVDGYGSLVPATIVGHTVGTLFSDDTGSPSVLNITINKLAGVYPPKALFTSLSFTDQNSNAVLVLSSAASYTTFGLVATWKWNLAHASPFANLGVYNVTVA